MTILLFAVGNGLAIFCMAILRIFVTGQVDGHYGIVGSIFKTIPSTAAMCVVSTIVFAILVLSQRRTASWRRAPTLGAIAGVTGYCLAWIASNLFAFGMAGLVAVVTSFAVCAGAMAIFTHRKAATSILGS